MSPEACSVRIQVPRDGRASSPRRSCPSTPAHLESPAARQRLPARADRRPVRQIRQGQVTDRPIYVALGIHCHGERDVLAELRNQGVQEEPIACCDGLEGLPEAIEEIWPQATVQPAPGPLVAAACLQDALEPARPCSAVDLHLSGSIRRAAVRRGQHPTVRRSGGRARHRSGITAYGLKSR
ncbi:transposase [Actinomadura sp. NPDC048394]|uniref:transposase n=1 Tax=Actinomadura sp. NPDC048394 TaxID=3158223 RepID=UPI0034003F58